MQILFSQNIQNLFRNYLYVLFYFPQQNSILFNHFFSFIFTYIFNFSDSFIHIIDKFHIIKVLIFYISLYPDSFCACFYRIMTKYIISDSRLAINKGNCFLLSIYCNFFIATIFTSDMPYCSSYFIFFVIPFFHRIWLLSAILLMSFNLLYRPIIMTARCADKITSNAASADPRVIGISKQLFL